MTLEGDTTYITHAERLLNSHIEKYKQKGTLTTGQAVSNLRRYEVEVGPITTNIYTRSCPRS